MVGIPKFLRGHTHRGIVAESNPYAIRAGLLELAKSILVENAHMKWQSSKETGKPSEWKSFTTEEVVKEAEKLYAFVSKK